MHPLTSSGEIIHGVTEGTSRIVLDVLGPTVEFLTSPAAAHDDFCVMRGVIPPGVAVPLHSHDATEVFFVLSGTKQVLTLGSEPAEWVDVRAGDYVHVPRGTRHAHRNVSGEPLIELVITTARLGSWFEEVGTPDTGARRPPTPDVLANFLAVSRKFGYWLGSPEENAAVGIRLPEVTGSGSPGHLSRSRGPVPGRPLGEVPMFVAVSLLLAAACLLPAAGKLLGHPKMRQSAARFGIRWRHYRLIGAAELAAATGILFGLWWHPLGLAAAAGMALLLFGAVITHRRAADGGKEMAPALLALAIAVAYLAIALSS